MRHRGAAAWVAVIVLAVSCGGGGGASGGSSAAAATGPRTPKLAGISVTLLPQVMEVGRSTSAYITAFDDTGELTAPPPAVWSSSAPSVAAVSADGTVTTITPGTVVISAVAAGFAASASLTVVPLPTPPSTILRVSPNVASVSVGAVVAYHAIAVHADTSTSDPGPVTWATLQPTIAIVDDSGVVTAVGAGTTIVTAHAPDPAGGTPLIGSATLTVSPLIDAGAVVSVLAPVPNALVTDTIQYEVVVASSRAVDSVVAAIDATAINLPQVALGARKAIQGWGAKLPIDLMADGPHRVVVTAFLRGGGQRADTLSVTKEASSTGGNVGGGGRKVRRSAPATPKRSSGRAFE